MHEMSICANIIEILQEQAQEQFFAKVVKLRLGIGQLANIEVDALQFGFGVVAQGTLAEDAELQITEIPGTAWCSNCAKEVPLSEHFSPCPLCSELGLTPQGGTELKIQNIEVV